MFLFKRKNGVFYVKEGKRKKSLRTTNIKEAKAIFQALQKTSLQNQLNIVDEYKENITIQEFFEEYCKKRYDLSPETIKKDKTSIKLLINTVGDISINQINNDIIEKFKVGCVKRGVKKISINSYLRHIKAFLNSAYEDKVIKKEVKIKTLKTGKVLPKVLDVETQKKILNYTKLNDFETYRTIIFALYTGCRVSEIINLKYEDIEQHNKDLIVKIKGKGDKERNILLLPEVVKILNLKEEKKEDFIFKQMKANSLTRKVHKVMKKCNIQGYSFHSLRHTSATQMLSSGIRLEVVQKILGHSSIGTTQIYAQIVDKVKNEEMKKLKY